MNIGMASFSGDIPADKLPVAIKPKVSIKHASKSFEDLCAEIGDTQLVRHYKAVIAATDCKQCATRRAQVALQAWLTKQNKAV